MNARACIATLVLLLLAAPAASGEVVDVYEYAPDRIYPVRTALGLTTQIVLDPNERVLDFSTGFSSGWDLVRRDNVFYLRPRDEDVDTNLVVRTETGGYLFELRVVASDWTRLEQARQAGAQYRIAFTYPADHGFSMPAAPQPIEVPRGDSIHLGIEPTRNYHFGYDVAAGGAASWMLPLGVHDDGRFTYVRLAEAPPLPSGSFPAVFGRSTVDGDDFIVNSTVRGEVIAIHGIHPYLVLRHGRNVLGLRRREE